jgi:hypothetical protein
MVVLAVGDGSFIVTEVVICKCLAVGGLDFNARRKFAILLAESNLSRIKRS